MNESPTIHYSPRTTSGPPVPLVSLVLVAASVAACANEVTAPAYGMMGAGFFFARRLPVNLQPSDAQRTQIKSLMTAYRTAQESAPARQRLTSADEQLAGDIQQVLTPGQNAWLATHTRRSGEHHARTTQHLVIPRRE